MEAVAKPIPGFGEFSSQMDSPFVARCKDGSSIKFRLIGANDLYQDERTHSFSLMFQAPPATPPEQRIYSLTNSELGTHELFLVPVKQTDEGLVFEAAFNMVKN